MSLPTSPLPTNAKTSAADNHDSTINVRVQRALEKAQHIDTHGGSGYIQHGGPGKLDDGSLKDDSWKNDWKSWTRRVADHEHSEKKWTDEEWTAWKRQKREEEWKEQERKWEEWDSWEREKRKELSQGEGQGWDGWDRGTDSTKSGHDWCKTVGSFWDFTSPVCVEVSLLKIVFLNH